MERGALVVGNGLLRDQDGKQLRLGYGYARELLNAARIIITVLLPVIFDGQVEPLLHELDVPENGAPVQPEVLAYLSAVGIRLTLQLVVDVHHPLIRRPGMTVLLVSAPGHRIPFCSWPIAVSSRFSSALSSASVGRCSL